MNTSTTKITTVLAKDSIPLGPIILRKYWLSLSNNVGNLDTRLVFGDLNSMVYGIGDPQTRVQCPYINKSMDYGPMALC